MAGMTLWYLFGFERFHGDGVRADVYDPTEREAVGWVRHPHLLAVIHAAACLIYLQGHNEHAQRFPFAREINKRSTINNSRRRTPSILLTTRTVRANRPCCLPVKPEEQLFYPTNHLFHELGWSGGHMWVSVGGGAHAECPAREKVKNKAPWSSR